MAGLGGGEQQRGGEDWGGGGLAVLGSQWDWSRVQLADLWRRTRDERDSRSGWAATRMADGHALIGRLCEAPPVAGMTDERTAACEWASWVGPIHSWHGWPVLVALSAHCWCSEPWSSGGGPVRLLRYRAGGGTSSRSSGTRPRAAPLGTSTRTPVDPVGEEEPWSRAPSVEAPRAGQAGGSTGPVARKKSKTPDWMQRAGLCLWGRRGGALFQPACHGPSGPVVSCLPRTLRATSLVQMTSRIETDGMCILQRGLSSVPHGAGRGLAGGMAWFALSMHRRTPASKCGFSSRHRPDKLHVPQPRGLASAQLALTLGLSGTMDGIRVRLPRTCLAVVMVAELLACPAPTPWPRSRHMHRVTRCARCLARQHRG